MHTNDELHARYAALMSHHDQLSDGIQEGGAAVTTLAVTPGDPPTRTALRTRLTDLFRRRPDLRMVILTAGEDTLGVVHRDTLRPDEPDEGRMTGVDGAQPMPGPPVRARARYFACTEAQCEECTGGRCSAAEFVLFGDGRPPRCPHGHGPMTEEE
ncbi:hypothetical protein AV521_00465 [Streptomyces sp. IMTB 2501]|uniref:hypothetical protein n=1 Tax=Streptomyces sp. IMTB 2501 TaxID=1776340 RepID=UPI00096C9EE0|nr:hypothetical protein [Streptomyces sp. IMTB 2501]OLZ74206.1 hypothetical protein AV521_00465 [Streptomyces sp. IMTB 2501]